VTDPGKAVFLSYASQDADAAQHLCNALRSAGIEVWFDQSELRGGDTWDASIRRQIKSCALFIPVISKNTHNRGEGYFRLEWKLAVDRSHLMASDLPFLLPVLVDDTPDQEDRVPDRFREVQWTRLPGGGNAQSFVDHVRRLLSLNLPTPAATSVGPSTPFTSTAGAATSRSKPPAFRSFVPWIAGFLLIVALGYIVADKFLAFKPAVPAPQAPAKAPVQAERVSDKSVAVLPFVDMSEKKDQEYFSDGLSEELIDQLAHSADLRVIARTSSFQFKGRNEDVRTIGQRLGVANLLEGSVRTSGRTMRITAQLIRASDGSHLWSEEYDRDMGDIFKVQDSIAREVVNALQATMHGQTSSSEHKPVNAEAYSAYLRGVYFQNKFTEQDTKRSIEALQESARIDPGFALAWAALARSYENQAIMGIVPPGAAHAEARKAVDHALNIDPNLAYAHSQLAAIEWNSFNFSAARAEQSRVRELDPNEISLLNAEAIEAGNAGRFDDAIDFYRQAMKRDPLNLRWLGYLFNMNMMADRLSDAETAVKEMLAIDPHYDGAHCSLGYILLARNKPDAALATMSGEPDKDTRSWCTADAQWALGSRTESDELLARTKAQYSETKAFDIATMYARRNDKDEAFVWLDRAYRNREPVVTTMGGLQDLRNLRNDPRFTAMMRRLKLIP
jgi:TolB-like protein/Tfp pilus assembly protein PilF